MYKVHAYKLIINSHISSISKRILTLARTDYDVPRPLLDLAYLAEVAKPHHIIVTTSEIRWYGKG